MLKRMWQKIRFRSGLARSRHGGLRKAAPKIRRMRTSWFAIAFLAIGVAAFAQEKKGGEEKKGGNTHFTPAKPPSRGPAPARPSAKPAPTPPAQTHFADRSGHPEA